MAAGVSSAAVPRWFVAAVLVVLGSACGLSSQDEPVTMEPAEVPFGLLAPPTTEAPAPVTSTTTEGVRVTVFLVGPAGPVPVARSMPGESPTLRVALSALSTGPTSEEAELGLHSAVPPGATLRAIGLERAVATVALDDQFLELGPGEQVDALAQVVFTATGIEGVDRVLFKVGGERVAVPTLDGSIADGPVGRRDYSAVGSR